MPTYDITIVGGGIVGMTAALALAKQTSLSIAIIEANSPPSFEANSDYDFRVSAVSLASKNIFKHLNCWETILAKRISPYNKMIVWDEGSDGIIHFDSQSLHESVLGYIIEDKVIKTSLIENIAHYPNIHIICPAKLISLQENKDYISLTSDTEEVIKTALVIAADGAESWVRRACGFKLNSWEYGHTAIVTTVKSELPHDKTAWQRFLSTGPLAFLPLDEPNTCSIVWSAEPFFAKKLLSLDNSDFSQILTEKLGYKLGRIEALDRRHSFPLRMRHAKNYIRSRIALIGDAAHTIHPLAGQGVNLGLLDAVSLCEVIHKAREKKRDFSSFFTLRQYERRQKTDVLMMLSLVEGLKHLFGNEKKIVKYIRGAGLNMVDHLPFIKNYLAHYALGKRSDLPELAKQAGNIGKCYV